VVVVWSGLGFWCGGVSAGRRILLLVIRKFMWCVDDWGGVTIVTQVSL